MEEQDSRDKTVRGGGQTSVSNRDVTWEKEATNPHRMDGTFGG